MTLRFTPTPEFDQSRQEQQRAALYALFLLLALLIAFLGIRLWWFSTTSLLGVATLAAIILLTLIVNGMWLRRHHVTATGWWILCAGQISMLWIGIRLEGMNWLFAIAAIAWGVQISLLLLPRPHRRFAVWSGFLPAGMILSSHLAFPLPHIFLTPEQQISISILIILWIALYSLLLYHYAASLLVKSLVMVATTALAPLGLLAIITTRNLADIQQETTAQSLQTASRLTASSLDQFLTNALNQTRTYAQLPQLPRFLLAPPTGREYDLLWREIQSTLLSLKRQDQVHIFSIAIVNAQGWNLIDTKTEWIGRSEADQPYLYYVLSSGLPVITPVNAVENTFYFAAPVRSQIETGMETDSILGILRIQYSASILQKFILENKGLAGPDSFAILVNQQGIFLAHGGDRSALFKAALSLDPETIETLQARQWLPPGEITDLSLHLDDLEPVVRSPQPEKTWRVRLFPGDPSWWVISAYPLKNTPWTVLYAQPEVAFQAAVQRQTWIGVGIFISIALIAAAVSLASARIQIRPILELTHIADRIRQGEREIEIPVQARDEIGHLAQAFQAMLAEIQNLIASLEQHVQERTQDLALRSTYLQAAAEIGSILTSTLDLNVLEQRTVELIRERFNLYYVGLFELDGSGEWAHLRAGTGEAGRRMLERGHRIKVGQGMIGWAIQHAQPRIAQKAELDEVRLRTPELPNTRSEAALPLRSRDRVLGALSIQSDQPDAFNPDTLAIFQVLADQIAAALDNARLFSENQETLQGLQRLYAERTGLEWQSTFRRLDQMLAFRSDGYTVRAIPPALSEPARQALHSGQPILTDDPRSALGDHLIYVPIRVRGVPLGVLRTYKPADRGPWTEDEITALTNICEQIGLALDTARLFHETQRRAAKEHTIREISARIGETIEISEIMQIAVEELGRALGDAEITLQWQPQDDHR